MSYKVTRNELGDLDESSLRERMGAEGLNPYSWSNLPHDLYSPHACALEDCFHLDLHAHCE